VTTTADLAADLRVDEGDIALLLDHLAEDDPDLAGDAVSDEAASFIRQLLDPHGERTTPAGLYWPGADPQSRRVYGLDGPDPTAPQGDVPQL
jgi:hypothetical protein